LTASQRLRRALRNISLLGLTAGIILILLAPQGHYVQLYKEGGILVALAGFAGIFFWLLTSVFAWLARIVGEDVRDNYRGVMRDDEYDHRD